MGFTRTGVVLVACTVLGIAQAAVFKCTGPGGRPVYMDRPCEGMESGGKALDIKSVPVARAASPGANAGVALSVLDDLALQKRRHTADEQVRGMSSVQSEMERMRELGTPQHLETARRYGELIRDANARRDAVHVEIAKRFKSVPLNYDGEAEFSVTENNGRTTTPRMAKLHLQEDVPGLFQVGMTMDFREVRALRVKLPDGRVVAGPIIDFAGGWASFDARRAGS